MSNAPTVRTMAANVLRVWDMASDADMAEGVAWYATAHDESQRIADAHGVTLERAAAVVAVLSPRLEWNANVRMAWLAYESQGAVPLPCLSDSSDKARRLVTGAPIADNVRGPKVTAFHACIVDPADPALVVVDRHAIGIALGRPGTKAELSAYSTGRRFAAVAEAYRLAATLISERTGQKVSPATVQAVTWVAWRRMK